MEEINVRIANDSDTEGINDFYNSIYKSTRDRSKFNWEFNTSPAGKAIYILAEHGGKIVGTQCVIPYFLITSENKTILSGKSEDTLVSPDYRGKNIFEKMYTLLFEACRKNNIAFIWGFTYASSPFLKLGFQIPFHTKMGLLVLKPDKARNYFISLSVKNTSFDKLKIAGLVFASWIKYKLRYFSPLKKLPLDWNTVSFSGESINYLKYKDYFGLKLDREFLKYRIEDNPYNRNYRTCNYIKNGVLLISLIFSITEQKIGYFIHVYISKEITEKAFSEFLNSVIQTTDLKTCSTLRFWGFSHNTQNKEEIALFNSAGFTFINRGISFVWKPLFDNVKLDPMKFILSRMASQGTD